MARYIDANKADVERIPCFYGSECRIEDVKAWLDEQPTADVVEVRHGYWIKKKTYPMGYECSECNNFETIKSPFCRLCGIKMDKKPEKGGFRC